MALLGEAWGRGEGNNLLSLLCPQNNILVVKDDINHPMSVVSSTKSRYVWPITGVENGKQPRPSLEQNCAAAEVHHQSPFVPTGAFPPKPPRLERRASGKGTFFSIRLLEQRKEMLNPRNPDEPHLH